jgi:hypothetical protein
MKAERNLAANTLRGTLLLRMATLENSRKVDPCVIIRLKARCLHLAKGISIVKKLKEQA